MEYQKNIATNVYHGFGALIALIISYSIDIKMRTGLTDDHWTMKVVLGLAVGLFVYHTLSTKKLK